MATSDHLNDLTNEPAPFRLPSPVVDTKQSTCSRGSLPPRIRRLRPPDSSETFPSESTSIYDAEPVLSEKDDSPQSTGFDNEEDPNTLSPHVPWSSSLENTAPLPASYSSSAEARLRVLNVCSNSYQRPSTRLGTITERLSRRTTRASVLLSRAISASEEDGDERGILDAAPATAADRGSSPRPRPQRRCGPHHGRSFSLNDLDCLKPQFYLHDPSSCSTDILRAACLCETYPLHPKVPPPVRVPTPPGLPAFGSRAAMEYRMPAPERTSWTPQWLTSRSPAEAPRQLTCPPGIAGAEAPRTAPPTLTDGLKRLLGITRVVSPIPEEPTRATLPSYLIRADDGTVVRGRFGTRHSAHGVGREQLEHHPFHHDVAEMSGRRCISLDQAIEEIDKACAEAERQRMATASPRAHGDSSPRSWSGSPRLQGQNALTIAEVLSQDPPSTTPINASAGPRPVNQAVRSRQSLAFDRLGSGGSVRSQSTVGIDGVRHFIEHGERVSVEQIRDLSNQRRQRDECANCWLAFCVYCCDMEDPDGDVVDASRIMSPETGASAVQISPTRPLRIVHEQPRTPRMVYR